MLHLLADMTSAPRYTPTEDLILANPRRRFRTGVRWQYVLVSRPQRGCALVARLELCVQSNILSADTGNYDRSSEPTTGITSISLCQGPTTEAAIYSD